MNKVSVRELKNFDSPKQFESAYYGSSSLEIRAGMIHALSAQPWYDGFSPAWRIEFLLDVTEECAREAHRLSTQSRSRDSAEMEKDIKKLTQFAKMASMAFTGVLGILNLGFRGNRPANDYVFFNRLLRLMSEWDRAPYLTLNCDPLKRKVIEVLDWYYDVLKYDEKDLPDSWFTAVINTQEFGLLKQFQIDVVSQHLKKYLIGALGFRHGSEPPSKVLSQLVDTSCRTDLRKVASFWLENLAKSGALDSAVTLES